MAKNGGRCLRLFARIVRSFLGIELQTCAKTKCWYCINRVKESCLSTSIHNRGKLLLFSDGDIPRGQDVPASSCLTHDR